MEKILIGAVAGVFLGAFAVELLNRKSPQTIKKLEDRAARVADQATEVAGRLTAGLKEGYSDEREPESC